jgi:hypothetical protein
LHLAKHNKFAWREPDRILASAWHEQQQHQMRGDAVSASTIFSELAGSRQTHSALDLLPSKRADAPML